MVELVVLFEVKGYDLAVKTANLHFLPGREL